MPGFRTSSADASGGLEAKPLSAVTGARVGGRTDMLDPVKATVASVAKRSRRRVAASASRHQVIARRAGVGGHASRFLDKI